MAGKRGDDGQGYGVSCLSGSPRAVEDDWMEYYMYVCMQAERERERGRFLFFPKGDWQIAPLRFSASDGWLNGFNASLAWHGIALRCWIMI